MTQLQDEVTIDIAGRRYACTVVRGSRRRKTMVLQIRPDASIEVRAPLHTPLPYIEQWLRQRVTWLADRLARMERLQAQFPPPRYGEGDMHWYLGHVYPLRLTDTGCDQVRLVDDHFIVVARNTDAVRRHLSHWYRHQAGHVFMQRLHMLVADIPWLTKAPLLAIRAMRRQWGSCSSAGRISLNLHLIKAPLICIDYVLAHELCHLREHHHGRRFYALLDEVMPTWRQHRQQLNGLAYALLRE